MPAWLGFDAETLTLSGTAPSVYVGQIPVRIEVGASLEEGRPAFSLIKSFEVDGPPTFGGSGAAFSLTTQDERLRLVSSEDFNGMVAISYTAVDVKGAVSADPAIIVINIAARRELPDPAQDHFTVDEDGSLTFTLAQVLLNDRDDDGDPVRVTSMLQPVSGTLTIHIPEVSVDLPALTGLAGAAVHSATLANGAPLPSWLSIDAATGRLSGTPPLSEKSSLNVTVHSTDGLTSLDTVWPSMWMETPA